MDVDNHPEAASKIMGKPEAAKGIGNRLKALDDMYDKGYIRVRDNVVDANLSSMRRDHFAVAVDKAAAFAQYHQMRYINVDTPIPNRPSIKIRLEDIGEFLANPMGFIMRGGSDIASNQEPPASRKKALA